MEEFVPVNYKVPLNPISDNKNVISSNPILNNMDSIPNLIAPGIINPQNNTYYNTYINPYAFNNPGLSYMNMQQHYPMNNFQRNYMGNILPNNFQGKIPINQYGNYHSYGNYPVNQNPVPRIPNYGNSQIPYNSMNGNVNLLQMNIPQNNSIKSINAQMTDIKPPNSDSLDENIPFPPEPEPEDIKIEKDII